MTNLSYQIRPARAADLPHLPAIERAAAQLFAVTPYTFITEDGGMSLASFEAHFARHYIWVAVDQTDQPVGFAIARPADGSLYLHEIDVHPQHGRRGLGRQLIGTVIAHARREGYPAVTLSTFDNVAWNAPYYATLGFQPLATTELGLDLQAVRQGEGESGLDLNHRVCMILQLTHAEK